MKTQKQPIGIAKQTIRGLLMLVLCLSFATGIQHSAMAADEVDPECDKSNTEEYDPEMCAELRSAGDDGGDLTGEDEDGADAPAPTPAPVPAPAPAPTPAPTTPECTGSMKECAVPETGPSEVIASLIGVSVLGYGARKWMQSRQDRQSALKELYQKDKNV